MRPARFGAWLAAWVFASAPAGAWLTGSAGEPLHVAGVIAGVLGAGWFAVSLCLMVRLRALEHAFGGLDQLYFAHHVTGAVAYLFLLAHPLLLAFAQYQRSPAASMALLLPAVGDAPMVAGWAALITLMVMMVTMFLVPMRYVRWKRLHAFSLLA